MGMPEWVIMPRGNFQTSGCTIARSDNDGIGQCGSDNFRGNDRNS